MTAVEGGSRATQEVSAALPPLGAWVGQMWGWGAEDACSAARRLESAGYGVLWISEALGREVFAFAGVLLAATERLVVATGIANLWARDPAAMANGARTLAEAFPGRFVLGVGVSHAPLVDRRGHDYGSPLAVMRDYLVAMRDAPYRAPAPGRKPPLLVGALGDRMLELAAEHTDGAHPYLVTPAHTAHARQVLGAGRLLAPEQPVVRTADPEVARAVARAHLSTYLGLDNYVRSLQRQGFADADLAGGGSDRLVDALVAWGDDERIAARVTQHRAAGADHVALHPLPGDGVADPVAQLVELAPVVRPEPAPGGATPAGRSAAGDVRQALGAAGLLGIDHLGVAVRSIPEALGLFQDVLGGRFVLGADDPVYGMRTIQLTYPPGVKLEVMQPLRDDCYLHGYLDERGEGFHHLTLFVADLQVTLAALQERGYQVVDTATDNPKWRVTYVRPRSGFGTLLQVAETSVGWNEPVPGVTLDRVLAGDVIWYDERPTLRSDLPPGVDPGI